MRRPPAGLVFLLLFMLVAPFAAAQPGAIAGDPSVPRVIRFNGTLAVAPGRVAVTFGLYQEETGGEPLWSDTQTLDIGAAGRYTAVLGLTAALPTDVFAGGEARWLDVAAEGVAPQPRRLLVSVPYALKAADAETIGGKPLSAFVLAGEKTGVGADGLTYVDTRVLAAGVAGGPPSPLGGSGAAGGAGTPGYLGVFTDPTTLGDSVIYQSGTGIGINTAAPAAGFHASSAASPVAFFDVYSNALGALPVVYRAARGTPAAPTAVQTNDILGGLAVRGYGTTGFTAGRGQVMFRAAENWTDAANGTYLQFTTTPVGGAGWVERLRITPDGKVGIGTATPVQTLSVAGTIESTTGGFRFPDGTILGTAIPSPSGVNPLQLALGRWYRSNLSLETTCLQPTSLAFDGTSIRIAGTVRSSTLTYPQTASIATDSLTWPIAGCLKASPGPVPEHSVVMTLSESGVWYGYQNDLYLDWSCRLGTACTSRASAVVQAAPTALAYDGVRLWVATGTFLYSYVDEVDPIKHTLPAPIRYTNKAIGQAKALLFDGTYLWVAGSTLARILPNADAGVVPEVYQVAAGGLTAVTFDGTYLWTSTGDGQVVKLRASDGREIARISVGGAPTALLFDGRRIWVANSPLDRVTVIDAGSGAIERTFAAGTSPTALAFDGMNVWIASRGSTSWGTLMKR